MPIINVNPGLKELIVREEPTVPRKSSGIEQGDMPAVFRSDRHPLLEAVHRAFDKHLGLRISASDILYVLMQQHALWQLDHDKDLPKADRKSLVVNRSNFVLGGTNDWESVFPEFMGLMDETKDSFPELSTDDKPVIRMSRAVAMMEANQHRYTYTVYTKCGIRHVDVRGSKADWDAVLKWVRESESPGVNAAEATIRRAFVECDPVFWKDVYKRDEGSGHAMIDGWILDLFPYFYDKGGEIKQPKYKSRNQKWFPSSGISSVPFVWDYHGTEIPMKVCAGMVGCAGESEIHLEYGWEVIRTNDAV